MSSLVEEALKFDATRKHLLLLAFSLFCIAVPDYAAAVTLEWDASPESNLIGYKVYYDTESGHPYGGTKSVEGDSPIDVGNVSQDSRLLG